MYLFDFIRNNSDIFEGICKAHKVEKMYAFGSSITDKFDFEKSDVDLLVHLDIDNPLDRGEALMSLWDKLETFFSNKVDLLTADSLKNPYLKKSIEETKVEIYDGQGEKVLV
ncbi:nucleotidyltransferase family protein [Marivirga sp.]|uniref:nucleotidyltransferase family protein n=1 Tax=Marivirga sp. TaxID=2018662 RepID=UPI003DA754C7